MIYSKKKTKGARLMYKYLLYAVTIFFATTVTVSADQVEIDADRQFYITFAHEACGVEIAVDEAGVVNIYVGDDLVAVITIVDHRQAYLDSYQDGVLLGSYAYQPFDERSVKSRDAYIDGLLDSYGIPPLDQLDAMSCITA